MPDLAKKLNVELSGAKRQGGRVGSVFAKARWMFKRRC